MRHTVRHDGLDTPREQERCGWAAGLKVAARGLGYVIERCLDQLRVRGIDIMYNIADSVSAAKLSEQRPGQLREIVKRFQAQNLRHLRRVMQQGLHIFNKRHQLSL
jgi:hypothetical protein